MRLKSILLAVMMLVAYPATKVSAADDVVGKIADEFAVTPNGQVSYEIPIPVPSGTGGISPKLSITYSSSNKTGLCGYGFDLTGLSMISRVPQNMYNDNCAGVVTFTSEDRFALDGSRLISTGTNTYSTEVNNFSKITSEGPADNPTSFTVQTKDGLTYEYQACNTLFRSQEKSLFWVVTKVTDTKGNYFTVAYAGDATINEVYPTRIDYTGNTSASLTPYASVRFTYDTDPRAVTTYVYGKKVKHSKRITDIKLYSGEKVIKSFYLSYVLQNYNYQLTKVIEYAEDGTAKKPTVFTWKNTNVGISLKDGLTSDKIKKARLTVGDFNGDGLTDFVITPKDKKAGWKGWQLFLNKNGVFDNNPSTGTFTSDEVLQVVSGDYNGDGYDDIAVLIKYNDWYQTHVYLSSLNGSQVVFKSPSIRVISVKQKYSIQTIRATGEGFAELFAWYENSKKSEIYYTRSSSSPLANSSVYNTNKNWDCVEFGDVNGDGKTDVFNFTEDGYTVMISSRTGFFNETRSQQWPSKLHHHYLGDYNGDGKTDILLTGWDKDPNDGGWANWAMLYSDGTGTFQREYFTRHFRSKDRKIFVMDLDGDGFDDLIAVNKTTASGNNTNNLFYYHNNAINTGSDFSSVAGINTKGLDEWNFHFGDFDGDGKTDIICTSNWEKNSWNGIKRYAAKSGENNLLSKITDGMGNATEITYRHMSDPAVYQRGTTFSYPMSSFGSSWPLVYEVKTPNGIGGNDIKRYTYENALMHRRGKGVLGFQGFTEKDMTNDVTTTSSFGLLAKPVMVNTQIVTKVGSRTVSTNNMVYSTKDASSASFWYVPVSTVENKFDYVSGTHLSTTTTTLEYDQYGNVTKSTTSNGSVTTTTVNKYTNNTSKWILGRLTESTVTKSGSMGTENRTAKFEYDAASGLMTAEYTEPSNTALGFKKTYSRDAFGNIVSSTTTPNNTSYAARTEKTTYDDKGRYILTQTNSLGHKVTNEMNLDNGLLKSSTDMDGIKTTNTYDSFGNLIKASDPLVTAETTVAWASSHADAPSTALYYCEKRATGTPKTIEFYDCLGRVVRKVAETGNTGSLTKTYTDIQYNAKGQPYKTSEPYFPGNTIYWNTNTYDACGRVITQTAPDGKSYSFTYDGLKTITTDPLGHKTTKEVDVNGLLVKSTDNDGNSVTYQYNVSGKCTQVKGPRTTIKMEYDLMGNRTKLDDPDLGVSTSVYNAYGEMVSQTDGKGKTTYQYDKGGRLTNENRPDMKVVIGYSSTNNNVTYKRSSSTGTPSASSGDGVVYSYDSYGRVTQEKRYVGSKTFTTSFTYNNKNLLDVITYPSGLKIKNVYRDNGFLYKVQNQGTGKDLWQLDKTDARGQEETVTYGNGLTTQTVYNAAKGYVQRITLSKASSSLVDMIYSFNAVGNLTLRRDNLRNLVEDFVYDTLDRLVKVKKNGAITQEMTYDAAGNILSKTGVGHDFQYASGTNRLDSYVSDGYEGKLWDAIEYTSFNKIRYIESGGKSMTLTYGPGKSRIMTVMKTGSTVNETKYYAGSYYEEISKSNGEVQKINYIFADGKTIAIFETSNKAADQLRYVHHDHLGSISAYTNESGALVQELSYDAWGRRRNPTNWAYYTNTSDANAWHPRGFGGHEHLDVFDMVNMDGRMYDPVLGRFLSPDPFVQAPDFTQSLNRYSYCMNNPLSLVDPSGYSWFSKNWKSLVASAVGIAVSAITAGSASGLGIAIIAGAVGGAAGAMTGALLNGANIGQIAKATFVGAVMGGIGGCLSNISADRDLIAAVFKHAFTSGGMEAVQGGNFFHGFMVGGVTAAGGSYLNKYCDVLGKVGKITANAVVGGTASEIGGGKFANGAITGAFSMMFNEMMHSYRKIRTITFKMLGQVPYDMKPATMANICLDLKVSIVEIHYPDGNVSIDGIGVMADIDGVTLSPGMEMTINADNDSKSFYFSKQYSGPSLTQKGYHYFGEVHTGNLNLSKYQSVSVTLRPSIICYDPSMGRGVPTLPGTLGLVPSQWLMKKSFKLK